MFHPQTDGQSKVTKRIITIYLHCLAGNARRAVLAAMGRVLLQHVLPDWSPRHSIRSCLLARVTINGSILGRGNKSGRGGPPTAVPWSSLNKSAAALCKRSP
jgi:hypothetical protein